MREPLVCSGLGVSRFCVGKGTLMKNWRLLAAALCTWLLLACGGVAQMGGEDSETHFLALCQAGACGEGLSCICGVCTVVCDPAQSCSELNSAASCQVPPESAGTACGEASQPSVCDVTCAADGDCASLGADYRCADGACRLADCVYAGKAYSAGQGFPSEDGCNSCGCDEDGTVFCTTRDCSEPDVCDLEFDAGSCLAAVEVYWHNPATGQCEVQTYGGCGGNGNRFESADACSMACGGGGISPQPTCDYAGQTYQVGQVFPSTDGCNSCNCAAGSQGEGTVICTMAACADTCSLQFDAGPCEASMPVYWHNPDTGVCELRSYGGCDGNANRYATAEECVNACNGTPPLNCESNGVTYAPGEPLPNDGDCGGCWCDEAGSGGIRCLTIQCFETPSFCSQPFDAGVCNAAFPVFSFNPATGQCDSQVYGGCGGNTNRFETMEACQGACLAPLGAACQVGGVVYPSGAEGIQEPTSCNTCSCQDGALICTEINCPVPCPDGQVSTSDCAFCGPTDACEVTRTGCVPTCSEDEECAAVGGLCVEQRCVNVCG